MPKFCTKCGNKLDGEPKFCPECGHGLTSDAKEKIPQPKLGEIKCPFCGGMFKPKWKRPHGRSTGDNIIKGAVFLPWGVVSALKSHDQVKCPHCKMIVNQK